MANTFKVVTKAGVTSEDIIYTVASSTTTVILGLVLGNTTSSQTTVTVTLSSNTGSRAGDNDENNQDVEKIDEVTYDMQSSQFSTKNTSKLTNKKGLNRFRWDLRHQGILEKNKKKNIKGPLIKPGNYQIQLSLDNEVFLKNNLEVYKNPNSDVLNSKLVELEKFKLKLIKKIKEAIQFADKLVILSNDKKISRKKSESLNEIIKDLVTEDGPYMQPMLIDQLKYLYNMVSRADQTLGKDAYNRFDELINQFEKLKKIEKII